MDDSFMSLLCRLGIGAYVIKPPKQLERIGDVWVYPGQMGVELSDCEEKVDVANVTCA